MSQGVSHATGETRAAGETLTAEALMVPYVDLVSDAAEQAPAGCPMAAAPDEVAEDILYYWDYLHLDALLSAQTPKSAERGGLVHDEIFFITVHQTYELW